MKKGKSLSQNIDDLFFKEGAVLSNEFENIYAALFNKPDQYLKIVEALSSVNRGITRDEICKLTGIPSSGELTRKLTELEYCGFIRKYIPFGKKHNSMRYQLTDCLSLFHLTFLLKTRGDLSPEMLLASNSYVVWCGLAYEIVVLNHIHQVKKALGINRLIFNS